MKKLFFFLVNTSLFALTAMVANGQATDKTSVLRALKQATAVFNEPAYQHFSMTYRFSYQSEPATVIDSMQAEYKGWQSHKWYRMDATETLVNDSLKVVLFNEDKLIWFGRNNADGQILQQWQQWEAWLTADTAAMYERVATEQGALFTIRFAQVRHCRSISFLINKKNKLVRVRQVVDPRLLADPEQAELSSPPQDWAVVDCEITPLPVNDFRAADFAIDRWLVKKENEWQPATGYADYKLFNASLK